MRCLIRSLVLLFAPYAFAQQYLVSTFAGGAPQATPAPALAASIGAPNGVAADAAGNFYFSGGECVFKVDRNGVLTRVAGNARLGYSGDGGPATSAQLAAPWGVAADASGNLYIADALNNRIRKVSTNGIITTVAGNGTAAYSGDGGPATQAALNSPLNVLVDASGNLFIADYSNNRIRKVSPKGIITTIAGGGSADPGDGGLATSAVIANPIGMAFDSSGNFYVANRQRMRVQKITPDGIITTVAGNGVAGSSGDGGQATNAELYLPTGIAVDSAGELFIADFGNHLVRKVSASGVISTLASVSAPAGVALDASGNLYIADQQTSRIQKVSANGANTIAAGNGIASFSGDGGPASAAQLNLPSSVAADAAGNVYISDFLNRSVRKVSPDGTINTVPGLNLVYPGALAVDAAGNLYVADEGRSQVFKVSASGSVSTVAGTGTQGYSGDGGPATSAKLENPEALAVDSSGNLYIVEAFSRLRKVSPSGTISTFAGGNSSITLNSGPYGVAVDSGGNVYVAARPYLEISPGGVVLNTLPEIAGTIALDGAGNIYTIFGNTVLRYSATGVSTVIAGNGQLGYSGDGGPATTAEFYNPGSLAVDTAGRVFIADGANFAVRVLTPVNQSVIVGAVVDAASESASPVSPGKIAVVYGSNLGPGAPATFQVNNGFIPTQLAGTSVLFNSLSGSGGVPAPVLYASATQVSFVVPYAVTGTQALVAVSHNGQMSGPFTVAVAASAPSLFTVNGTGAGQAAAINADGTVNSAINPARAGNYISLYATGEGQTTPQGVDGKLATHPLPTPDLPVSVTVGGIPAIVQYKGGGPGEVAGLMQVNVQIPAGVQPGGYVPVVLTVGDASSTPGAVWIAVTGP